MTELSGAGGEWSAAISWVKGRLEKRGEDRAPIPSGLARIATVFGLSTFEREVVLLCSAAELDGEIASACGGGFPTVGLMLGVLDNPHFSAFAPTSPLRQHRLVELGSGPLALTPVRIDERILYDLIGVATFDVRVAMLARPVEPVALAESHAEHATRLSTIWSSASRVLVQLLGGSAATRAGIALQAWSGHGEVLRLQAHDLLAHPDRELVASLCERERALTGTAFVIEIDDHDSPEVQRAAALFVERCTAVVAICAREPLRTASPWLRLDVATPTMTERRVRWAALASDTPLGADGIARVADQFDPDGQVELALSAGRARALDRPDDFERQLVEHCSAQRRHKLEELAQRVEPAARWTDLVLLPATMEMLQALAAQVPCRTRVYEQWGYASGVRGLGITALFAGPSGTGKTLAAEVIAHHLGVDLFRIDLSRVVSKYIGETEKNLRRVFDAAEDGGAVLLFDEADALFGKRSEVKDSHDRYANIEVSYLLQRMESYRGLAILTTNARDSLDQAFLRRLRFLIEFKFPDVPERIELWRRSFPAPSPREEIDLARLARLRITGGNVRTIALNAAFLAASRGEAIGHAHLFQAATFEYRKLGMALAELEPLRS